MLFPRIKRGSPEQVFAVWKNNEASTTLVDGDAVMLDTAAAAADLGNAIKKTTASVGLVLLAGVTYGADVVAGDYGTFLVYGVHNNAKVDGTATTGVDAAGLTLQSAAVVGVLGKGAAADDPSARAGVSLAAASPASTAGRGKIFLKMM